MTFDTPEELMAFLEDAVDKFYEYAEADDEIIGAFIDLVVREYENK